MEIKQLTAAEIDALLPGLTDLLIDAVDGGASVSYLSPVSPEEARRFWHNCAAEVRDGSRIVLAALADGQVVGCVHVSPAGQPNGHHRAEVQKLLVHSAWRRQGIASRLMAAAEAATTAHGRWLLVLDTQEGSDAERLYERLGYARAGVIPHFAQSSAGDYLGTVLFYKQLPR